MPTPKKITDLTEITTIPAGSFIEVVDSSDGINKKVKSENSTAPIYPANEIPYGDGTTAGGVTDAGVSVDLVNHFYAYGSGALNSQTGTNDVIGIGQGSCSGSSGNEVIGIGYNAAGGNTGNSVIALGTSAAQSNSGGNVIAIGQSAGAANPLSGMFIIANTELPSYVDWAAADAAISATGSPNNTYLYYDQTNKNIGAVRL